MKKAIQIGVLILAFALIAVCLAACGGSGSSGSSSAPPQLTGTYSGPYGDFTFLPGMQVVVNYPADMADKWGSISSGSTCSYTFFLQNHQFDDFRIADTMQFTYNGISNRFAVVTPITEPTEKEDGYITLSKDFPSGGTNFTFTKAFSSLAE